MGEILQFQTTAYRTQAARPLESGEIGLIRGGVSPRRRPPMGFVLQPDSFVLEGYWMEKNQNQMFSRFEAATVTIHDPEHRDRNGWCVDSLKVLDPNCFKSSDLPQSSLFEKREKRGLEFVESPVLDWKRRPNFWYKYL